MKNILFICKWNRFRSKVAESYFNKINSNEEISAKSAGIIYDYTPQDMDEDKAARDKGIEIDFGYQGMRLDLWDWADLIVVVADNVPKDIFRKDIGYDTEVECWNITDNHGHNISSMHNIIDQIKDNVEKLVERLNSLETKNGDI